MGATRTNETNIAVKKLAQQLNITRLAAAPEMQFFPDNDWKYLSHLSFSSQCFVSLQWCRYYLRLVTIYNSSLLSTFSVNFIFDYQSERHTITFCQNPFLDISSFLVTVHCHPPADMRNLSPGYQRCGLPRTYSLVYKIAVRSSRGYHRPSLWTYQPTGRNASCRMSPSHKRHAHIRNRRGRGRGGGGGATILGRTRINSRFGFALYCKPIVYSPRNWTRRIRIVLREIVLINVPWALQCTYKSPCMRADPLDDDH